MNFMLFFIRIHKKLCLLYLLYLICKIGLNHIVIYPRYLSKLSKNYFHRNLKFKKIKGFIYFRIFF
jgi:hypothetical protein